MSQILKKFIKPDAVDESKILLLNNGALRAKNAAGNADVSLMKLDAADKLQFLVLPQVASDPAAGNDIARKSWIDTQIAGVGGDLTTLEGRVTAIENDYAAPNGLATLDANGKIIESQLPSIAITDVYVVADIAARDALTVQTGDVAKVTDAGAGLPKTYIYTGTAWVEIESGSDVDSVFGRTGAVVAQAGDYNTAQVTEDPGALYFTEARAKAAAVSDAIVDGVTDVAASQNAVFDALALKLDLAGGTMSGGINMGANALTNVGGISSPDDLLISSGGTIAGLRLDSPTIIRLWTQTVEVNGARIANVGSPFFNEDAANKSYVDSAASNAQSAAQSYTDAQLDTLVVPVQHYQAVTLNNTQISAGTFDVAYTIVGTPWLMVDGVMLRSGVDFTFSGATIDFSASNPALEAGDVVHVYFMRNTNPFV